jgi:hypothetical protein
MGALPEFQNVDNARSTMPEYASKLTQMYQYLNRSVKKFFFDWGYRLATQRVYANNAAAIAAGLKRGDWYVSVSGTDLVVKIVQ